MSTPNENSINDLINDLQFISRYPENSNAPYICRLAAQKLTELNNQIDSLTKQRDKAILDIVSACHFCKHYSELPNCSHKIYAPGDPNCLGWEWHGLE